MRIETVSNEVFYNWAQIYAQLEVDTGYSFNMFKTCLRRIMFLSTYIRKVLQNLSTWAGYQTEVCGVQESLKTAVYLTFIAQRFLKHIRPVNFLIIALIIFNLFIIHQKFKN